MNDETDFYLVIDLEATCDDQGAVPKHEMEIIEVGAVLVETQGLTAVGEFQTFIKPVRHPALTPFCTQLTTITQADVDGAPGFRDAMEALRGFVGDRNVTFGSWGDYDRKQFDQDASYHRVGLPFLARHKNLKKAFAYELGEKKLLGMAQALARVGLPLVGTHHRGIDDARNIARLLPWSLGRAKGDAGGGRPSPRREVRG
jgi:inhibitor of KinA sporulation pathway (predicted exonuclease)